MKKLALLAALAAASLSTTAFAAEGNGGFIRAELGRSNVDVGVTDDSDTSFSIRGGYFFNSNVAIEGFYSNQYRADTGFGDEEAQLYSLGVGVVGKKNFGGDHKGFFISGRGGLAYTDVAYVEDGEVDIDEENDNSANLYLGVGIGYDFNERFGLSLNYDYQKAELNDADFDVRTLTLGGEFRF